MDGFLLDMGRVMELKASVAASREGHATLPHRLFSAADVAGVAAVARRQLIFAIHRVRDHGESLCSPCTCQ